MSVCPQVNHTLPLSLPSPLQDLVGIYTESHLRYDVGICILSLLGIAYCSLRIVGTNYSSYKYLVLCPVCDV